MEASGDNRFEGELEPGSSVGFRYRLHCPRVGRIRFEGVAFQMADLQGFFCHTTFLPYVMEFRVLPSVVEVESHGISVKRHNLLLPPGVHRHRRPGSGSELLDLRDYRPGDPPKTIAWKVSARRDRLITKEFESEVPVRCTLFIDTSDSVRLGPPGENALTRLIEIAAAVARATTQNRDLIGLCRFDQQGSTSVRPARGGRHLVRVLNRLAEISDLAPTTGRVNVDALLPLGYGFAQEVYPELMRPNVNHFPAWLAWLWPPPAYAKQRPSLGDYFFQGLPFLVVGYVVLALIVVGMALVALLEMLRESEFPLLPLFAIFSLIIFGASVVLFRVPPAFFFAGRRRRLRWRKRLAALLSVLYRLAPGGLGMLLEDDNRFAFYLQRFLADHHLPFPLTLYDQQGRYLFAFPRKVEVLAAALLRAVGKGHDNELFILLSDLLELPDRLDPLLRAVKVALSRHHRVLLICPWPPGIAPPPEGGARNAERGTTERGTRSAELGTKSHSALRTPHSALRTLTMRRFHRAFYHLRRTFARLGVPVVCAQEGDPASLILERLDMLREMRQKR
jgi:hypothetical protein